MTLTPERLAEIRKRLEAATPLGLIAHAPTDIADLLAEVERLQAQARRFARPECESCGKPADVRLSDGSAWCWSCDGAARALGYDDATKEPAK